MGEIEGKTKVMKGGEEDTARRDLEEEKDG